MLHIQPTEITSPTNRPPEVRWPAMSSCVVAGEVVPRPGVDGLNHVAYEIRYQWNHKLLDIFDANLKSATEILVPLVVVK